MTEYADTSFIVSLYTLDRNHVAAAGHAAGWLTAPLLPLTPFGRFELQNTLRRVLTPAESARVIGSIRRDLGGVFVMKPLESYRWIEVGDELSRRFIWRHKARALDVLHVAAALLQGRNVFLSFDRQQREFARACGLSVPTL